MSNPLLKDLAHLMSRPGVVVQGLSRPPPKAEAKARGMNGCTILVVVPIRIVNPLNNLRHWRHRSREANRVKEAVTLALRPYREGRPQPPYAVTMTRLIGKRGRDFDLDNLSAAFKHVRDTAAEFLGVDDAERFGVKWNYDQRKADDWGVEVVIETRKDG